MQISDIENQIASYLKQPVSAFLLASGENTLLNAINNARRTAERIHDFYYAQINAILPITAAGGNIINATNGVIQTSGSLIIGKTYQITAFSAGDNFTNVGAASNATGVIFKATGTTPTTWSNGSALQGSLNLKRVCNVLLPISGPSYLPIEFLTQDRWNARLRQMTGRQTFAAGNTLAQYGIYIENGIAVQQGQVISLYGPNVTLPITAQLDAIQFMPDYTLGTDQDFFCVASPEFLQWQAILDGNKLWSQFVPLQQGAVVEESVQQFASEALQSLIAWDVSVQEGTNPPRPEMQQPARRKAA